MTVVEKDAREFGLHVRQGGWRLGLLVARCVVKAPGRDSFSTEKLNGKVPAAEFARMSGTTAARVLRYLTAWEKAADAGYVPAAVTLTPGAESAEFDIDADRLPEWSDFYDASGAGGRPRDGKPEDALTIIGRQGPEERGQLVTQLLTDPDTRAAVVTQARGVAAVEAMHHSVQTNREPVRHSDELPPPPEFAPAFWRAVTAVHAAHGELLRWGVRDLEATPHTREAAEQMRAQADDIGHAVADYVVDNIPT